MALTGIEEFSVIARALQQECRRLGITAPAFRCPPHTKGQHRTLRRTPSGQVVVAVLIHRDPYEVTEDLIAGTIAANQIVDREAIELVRSALWEAAGLAVAA